jgi:NitT/TauT family transport system substrate-binding protein
LRRLALAALDMITTMMLEDNTLTGQVERRPVGGIGAGLAALREGGVDMTYLAQPLWAKEKDNFRIVFNSTTSTMTGFPSNGVAPGSA